MERLDFYVIGLYLVTMIVLGLWSSRGVKSFRDYAVSDKNFTLPVIVATIVSTFVGGNTLFGMANELLVVGIIFVLAHMGDPIYKLLLAKYVVPRLSRFYKSISIGDIVAYKFGDDARMLTGVAVFFKCIGSVGSQITAIAVCMSYVADIPVTLCVFSATAILILYATTGGVKSVVATDVVQFCIILTVLPLTCIFSVTEAGGIGQIASVIPEVGPEYTKGTYVKYTFYFFISLAQIFNPVVMHRMLMTTQLKDLRQSFNISAIVHLPILTVIVVMILSAYVLSPGISGGEVVPYLINRVLPAGVKGLAIVGILAVLMSTADSFLNTGTISLVNDFFRPLLKNLTPRQEIWIARLSTLIAGIAAAAASLYFNNIFKLYITFLNFWVPVVVVPIYAVLFNHRGTTRDFFGAALIGIMTAFSWKYFLEPVTQVPSLIVGLACNALYFYRRQLLEGARKMTFSTLKTWLTTERRTKTKTEKYKTVLPAKMNHDDHKQFSFVGIVGLLICYTTAAFLPVGTNLKALFFVGCTCSFLLFFQRQLEAVHWSFRYYANLLLCAFIFLVLPMLLLLTTTEEYAYFLLFMSFIFLALNFSTRDLIALVCFGSIACLSWIDLETTNLARLLILGGMLGVLVALRAAQDFLSERRHRIMIDSARAMAAETAHELNTPLVSVLASTEFVKATLDHKTTFTESEVAEMREHLGENRETIQSIFKRIELILQNMKFGHKTNLTETVNLNDLVHEVVADYRKRASGILVVEALPKSAIIHGSRVLLQNLLCNIINNALDALKNNEQKEPKISFNILKNNGSIDLKIKDNAGGIDAAMIVDVFDPFKSTKTNGTGVGLSYCRDVMRAHGGSLVCNTDHTTYTELVCLFKAADDKE